MARRARRGRFRAVLIPALSLIAAAACGPSPEAEPAWPPGTVLAVDDLPIGADDVDGELEPFAVFEPRSTERHLRRLVVSNVVLPRAVARLRAGPAAYERARSDAAILAAQIAATGSPPTDAPEELVLLGGPKQIGWQTWHRCFDLQPGEWSEVLAEAYDFRVVRLLRRPATSGPPEQGFEVAMISYPFVSDDFSPLPLEQTLREHRLTIVDPEYRTVVPEWIQYSMNAHTRSD